jgi:endonuclease/exonuclease/phosphatase family metal-dependent hydrolase
MKHPLTETEIPASLTTDTVIQVQRLRLLSYNIQVGIASTSLRSSIATAWKHVFPHAQLYENLHRIAEVTNGFDIVALQEVDAGSFRSSFINQIEYLADKGDFPYWFHQTNREIGKITKHSNGLLSRFQPYEVNDYKLPGPIPGRGVMVVRYGTPENPLILLILHLALGKRARRRQLEFVSEIVNCYEHVVVMGDLNCQPDSPELMYLLNTTNLCDPEHGLMTFPSWKPVRKIDHILTSPSLQVHDVHVLDHRLSDHLPIAMEISLPKDVMLAA